MLEEKLKMGSDNSGVRGWRDSEFIAVDEIYTEAAKVLNLTFQLFRSLSPDCDTWHSSAPAPKFH